MANYRDTDGINAEATPSRPWLRPAVIAGIAFCAGLIAMGWLLLNHGATLGVLPTARARPAETVSVAALEERSDVRAAALVDEVLDRTDPADLPIATRVARVEEQVERLDTRAGSAVGNADRAEGLLVAFAARRALDRGIALGYIESLLRERFGDVEPRAVAVVISAARQPVTLDGLQARLTELSPAMTGRAEDESWWDVARREMSEIFVVREAGTPSPAPSDRLQRANEKLAAGQVDSALAEVMRLPGQEAAAPWIADARRYVAARNALDRIETVALMQPRTAARREQTERDAEQVERDGADEN